MQITAEEANTPELSLRFHMQQRRLNRDERKMDMIEFHTFRAYACMQYLDDHKNCRKSGSEFHSCDKK